LINFALYYEHFPIGQNLAIHISKLGSSKSYEATSFNILDFLVQFVEHSLTIISTNFIVDLSALKDVMFSLIGSIVMAAIILT